MKILLMVLLIVTIAALSHLATTKIPTVRVAYEGRIRKMGHGASSFKIGSRTMWISIFAIISVAALCLAIGAFLMQPAENV